MHVLYFHQYFCTPQGSSGTRSYEMAKYLVSQGHKVTMVFARSPRLKSPIEHVPFKKGTRRGIFEGINLIELNIQYNNKFGLVKRALVFFRYAIRSIQPVFTEQYDVVFATSTPLTAGIPGIIMKMFNRRKAFVFEVRDLWPELPKEMGLIKNPIVLWLMSVLESLSYNKADACIALSPGIKKGIESKLKSSKPVFLVPNGSDLDLFQPGSVSKEVFTGCTDKDFVAVFTGAHGMANGLDAALDAAKCLKERSGTDHIKLVFIGDGILKKTLVERAAKEGLANCIFMSPVPKLELVKLLQAADVGLMLLANIPAFYYGTSPNKFFDYVSVGLPILNNYPGWLADMIGENKLGIAVPPDDPEAFAQALVELSNNKTQLKEMSLNSRSFAEEKFNRQVLAGKFLDALNHVVKE